MKFCIRMKGVNTYMKNKQSTCNLLNQLEDGEPSENHTMQIKNIPRRIFKDRRDVRGGCIF